MWYLPFYISTFTSGSLKYDVLISIYANEAFIPSSRQLKHVYVFLGSEWVYGWELRSNCKHHVNCNLNRGGRKDRIISLTQWKSPLPMPSKYFNTHFSSSSYKSDLIVNAFPKFVLTWNCLKIAADVDSTHFIFNRHLPFSQNPM